MIGDMASVARQVRCPALSININPEDASAVSALFDDVEIGHVVGAGHFLQIEVPEQFNAMVTTFLGKL